MNYISPQLFRIKIYFMKRSLVLIIIVFAFLMHPETSLAQQKGGSEEVKAVKVSLITDFMKLTPGQAAQFWPLYDKYNNEMRNVRKGRHNLTNEKGKTAEEIIDERQQLDERELSIKARYKDEFLKVVSAHQLNQMYLGEAKFVQYLMDRMKK